MGARPVHVLEIAGDRYLLAEGATCAHLVREAVAGRRRPAVDDEFFDPALPFLYDPTFAANYDVAQLREQRWAEKTICGKDWAVMAEEDVDPRIRSPHHSPDCRACLRSVGRKLQDAERDPRVDALADAVAAEVAESGSADVANVPGDQAEHLRRALRRAVAARGFRSRTYRFRYGVSVMSDEAIALIPPEVQAENQRRAFLPLYEAAGMDVEGHEPPRGRFDWREWERS